KHFADPINVVIIVRTDLETQRVGHVVLFSSDLSLDAERLVDYYALRFQIEFTFRDAKQYFGLEDFMGVKETCVANAVGLSFFLVNLSKHLLADLRTSSAGSGINDLKSYYRGRYYVTQILKIVSENAPPIVWSGIVEHVCRLGFIHPRRNTPTNNESEMQRAA